MQDQHISAFQIREDGPGRYPPQLAVLDFPTRGETVEEYLYYPHQNEHARLDSQQQINCHCYLFPRSDSGDLPI